MGSSQKKKRGVGNKKSWNKKCAIILQDVFYLLFFLATSESEKVEIVLKILNNTNES